jgi:arabinofuranosyltransferase
MATPTGQPMAMVRPWRPVHVVVLVAALGAYAVLVAATSEFLTDDAWITLRYAENLADGRGFVWNPGGPAVEGYSNPLLVLFEAGIDRVGLDPLAVVRAVSVVAGAATILVVALRGRAVVGTRGALSAAVLVAATPGLAFWANGGLETSLVTLLLTTAVLELARSADGSGLSAGLLLSPLPWLRPEAIAVVAALAVFVGGQRAWTRGWRPGVAVLGRVLVPAALAQAALEWQRLAVFGHLLPNPVLYKADGELGAVATRFLAELGPVLLLAALGVAALRVSAWVLAVPVTVHLVGGLTVADSVNAYGRFLLPTLPAAALLAGGALSAVARAVPTRPAWFVHGVGLAAVLVLVLQVLPGSVQDVVAEAEDYGACREAARRDAASWIRDHTDPSVVVSISDTGLVPTVAGRRTLDHFWLNDPRLQDLGHRPSVAHRVEGVLRARPDLVVLASRSPDRLRAAYSTDRAIGTSDAFDAYQRVHVASGGPTCTYHLLVHGRGT